ncbi:hypothetical protein Ancab_032449 [Ancistrocladus abbreviatus]
MGLNLYEPTPTRSSDGSLPSKTRVSSSSSVTDSICDGRASKHLKEKEKTQAIHLHHEAAGWANQQDFEHQSTVPGHSPGDGHQAPSQPDETRPTTPGHNPGASH